MSTINVTFPVDTDATGRQISARVRIEFKDKAGMCAVSFTGTVLLRNSAADRWTETSSGQVVDTLRAEFKDHPSYAVVDLLDLWKEFHLNDMRAGTPEQMNLVHNAERVHAGPGPFDYEHQVAALQTAGLYTVTVDGKPYRYGSAWLSQTLTADQIKLIEENAAAVNALSAEAPPIPTPREQAAAIIQKAGLTMTAEFVPFSRSRNAKEKHPSLNWKVTVKGAHSLAVIVTDYTQGSAHTPAYKRPANPSDKYASGAKQIAIKEECETGMNQGRRLRIPAPDITEIVASLAMDSDVLNSAGFEDWASEFDFDTDSRAAEATYRACLEIALNLRAMIGDKALAALQEIAREL